MTRALSPETAVEAVEITSGSVHLRGDLTIPAGAKGIVLFAHGSGSSRFSSRNRFVAEQLNDARLATLLLDLLTEEEEAVDMETGQHRFDIGLLTRRLTDAVLWVFAEPSTSTLSCGLFGASTGAAAALLTAAALGSRVKAVVSRGGRPDLAEPEALGKVKAPTLFIVGGNDMAVLALNQQAFHELACEKELALVPGATHLFEEPGALEEVASLSMRWFSWHLGQASR